MYKNINWIMLRAFYGVFSDRSLTRIIALPLFLTIGKRKFVLSPNRYKITYIYLNHQGIT